ncbi:MAG: hypothetical protein R3C56_18660 [Pirellulaceae bacterium]
MIDLQHFVDTACDHCDLAALLVVTKQPAWYEAYFETQLLEDIVIFEASKYSIVCGRKSS